MNQADYKAIAEIIRPYLMNVNLDYPQYVPQHIRDLINELADYFEKDNKEISEQNLKKARNEISFKNDYALFRENFNRSEFLKDCGVEE